MAGTFVNHERLLEENHNETRRDDSSNEIYPDPENPSELVPTSEPVIHQLEREGLLDIERFASTGGDWSLSDGNGAQLEDKETKESKSCLDGAAKLMPAWFKTVISLLVHSFDWCSDICVSVLLWLQGDRWWAFFNTICIMLGGFLGTLALEFSRSNNGKERLTWKDRIPVMFGIGPLVEAYKHPAIIKSGKVSPIFIIVRLTEVFGESVPGGALQVYIMIYKGQATWLQIFSLSMSVMSMGSGITAGMKDLDGPIGAFARLPIMTVTLLLGVTSDFIWRVVPLALFLQQQSFRPWSLLVVVPCMVLCECIKGALVQWWINKQKQNKRSETVMSWQEMNLNFFCSCLNPLSYAYPMFSTLWNGKESISNWSLNSSLSITMLVRLPINIACLMFSHIPSKRYLWISGASGVMSYLMGAILLWTVCTQAGRVSEKHKNPDMLRANDPEYEAEDAAANASWTCCY